MITVHRLNDFKLGNSAFMLANLLGYATLHGFEFGLTEPWKFQSYFKNPLPLLKHKPAKILQETQFQFYDLPAEDNVALSGYWQSYKRFAHCLDLVRHYFTFTDEAVDTAFKKHYPIEDGVIHLRLTDYAQFAKYHTNLQNTLYYRRALDQALAVSSNQMTRFLVCSDDINWCMNNPWLQADITAYERYNLNFSLNATAIDDLVQMANTRILIMANSSFSALGALLNTNAKNIYAPKQWFAEQGPKNWQDIYAPDWHII